MTSQGSPEQPLPEASGAGGDGPVGKVDSVPAADANAAPVGDTDANAAPVGDADADAAPIGEPDGAPRPVGRASVPTETGPAQLFDDDEMPPPPRATGWYRIDTGPPNHPSDPILPFVAPRTTRRRRREWPVLVVSLVIAAVVLAACCIAGFALYSNKGPFFQ